MLILRSYFVYYYAGQARLEVLKATAALLQRPDHEQLPCSPDLCFREYWKERTRGGITSASLFYVKSKPQNTHEVQGNTCLPMSYNPYISTVQLRKTKNTRPSRPRRIYNFTNPNTDKASLAFFFYSKNDQNKSHSKTFVPETRGPVAKRKNEINTWNEKRKLARSVSRVLGRREFPTNEE